MPNSIIQMLGREAMPLFSSQTAPAWGIPDLFQEFMQVYGRELADLGQDGNEPPDPVFSGSVAFAKTMISIVTEENGAVKIIKRGHVLVDEDPTKLNSPELVDTTRDFITTGEMLAAFEEETARLENELKEHRRFVAYEPALIDHEIRQAFPEGTAGKTVDILSSQFVYRLIVNGQFERNVVTAKFGEAIVARKKALAQTQTDIETKASRLEELGLKIRDARQAVSALNEKIKHLTDGLDLAKLKLELVGDFVGLTLNDQGQLMAVVSREIDEELAELPPEYKRQLIADHLAGDELPEEIQKTLGLKEVVQALDEAIGAPKPALENYQTALDVRFDVRAATKAMSKNKVSKTTEPTPKPKPAKR